MLNFNEVKKQNFEKLELYVPIVERVHGKEHPEFHDVRKFFDVISRKITKAGSQKPDLAEEFEQLRKATDNYTIPQGVCESYEAVYNMLSELDKAYHES